MHSGAAHMNNQISGGHVGLNFLFPFTLYYVPKLLSSYHLLGKICYFLATCLKTIVLGCFSFIASHLSFLFLPITF